MQNVVPQDCWLSRSVPNIEDMLATIPLNSLVSKEEELESKKDFEDIMCEVKKIHVEIPTKYNPIFIFISNIIVNCKLLALAINMHKRKTGPTLKFLVGPIIP